MTPAAIRRKKEGKERGKGKAVRRPALVRRPSTEQVEAECQKILNLWAEGKGDTEIRRDLGLSHGQYEKRVYRIAEDEWGNREGVWPKFLARGLARYREYQRVYRLAMEKVQEEERGDAPDAEGESAASAKPSRRRRGSAFALSARLRVALAALMAMSALDRDIIEVGQRLGVYPRAAEPEGEGPELAFRTLILEAARRAESARLREGEGEVLRDNPRALPHGSQPEVVEEESREGEDREGG